MRRFETILNIKWDLLSSILLAGNEIVMMIGLECKPASHRRRRERGGEDSGGFCLEMSTSGLVSSSLDTILVVLTL